MELPIQSRLMREWLFSQWSEKLAMILESMADVRPAFGTQSAGAETPAPDAFVWRQSFAIYPEASVCIATALSTCVDLGTRTLKAAGIESSEEADAQNTFLEILGQSFAALNQSIAEHLECPTGKTDGEQLAALPENENWVCLPCECGGVTLESFWLSCSKALLEKLSAGPAPEVADATGASEAASAPVASAPDASVGGSKTFDVMLDVSLPVSISFGRTFLPIKDVLKLSSGSIVELDRGVNEPVEIIVNNCVIARGEVVVIEGNYGVRIQQIASRYDRLRTGTSATQVQPGGGGKPQ